MNLQTPAARARCLQELQQLEPPDRREADAVDDDALAAIDDRHVPPGFHVWNDGRVGRLVVLAQEFERAVGEHDAEAEGGVGRVLLDHRDVGVGFAALDQVGG